MQKKLIGLFLLVAVSLCAWSPWISKDSAFRLAENQFNASWNTVIDGCGTFGGDLGPRDFRKIPFGARVTLEYQCGLVMPDEPALHTSVYVSFLGITFGYPKP